jgi:hypothetical protein
MIQLDLVNTVRIYLLLTVFSKGNSELPALERKEVVFTKEDIIEQFEIEFPNLSQDASIRDNYLYLPVGLHDLLPDNKRKDSHRDIIKINLDTQRIEKVIDIHSLVTGEPEDMDFYRNNLILYCGRKSGGVFVFGKIY